MPEVTVEILGQEYTLRSQAGEEVLHRVVRHLNKRLTEATDSGKAESQLAAALLAALNITNEYLQLKDQQSSLLREIEVKAEKLLERIEVLES